MEHIPHKYNGRLRTNTSLAAMGVVDYDTGLVVIDHALLSTKSKGVYEGETKTGSMRAIRLALQSLELLRKWKTEQLRMKLAQRDRWVDSGYNTRLQHNRIF